MPTNLQRFKTDLDKLINTGDLLLISMLRHIQGDTEFLKLLKEAKHKDPEAYLKSLPDFHNGYQKWYSESLALIRQLLPDRLNTFIALHDKPKTRKMIDSGNYVIQDFLQGLSTRTASLDAAYPQFKQQLSILKAAESRFESSLFEIRQLVQADLFDSEIETARELLRHKFLRAAGAIAGVVLEKHLQQVCNDHKVVIAKKNPGISDLNEALKAGGVIEIAQWRHITLLGDIRNICDHNKKKEPTEGEVSDLIDGTDKVVKTIS